MAHAQQGKAFAKWIVIEQTLIRLISAAPKTWVRLNMASRLGGYRWRWGSVLHWLLQQQQGLQLGHQQR